MERVCLGIKEILPVVTTLNAAWGTPFREEKLSCFYIEARCFMRLERKFMDPLNRCIGTDNIKEFLIVRDEIRSIEN